jgi:hypothetical protein
MNKIVIDGIEYAPVKAAGNRAVVVVNSGWIFAGDTEQIDTLVGKSIRITNALHIFKWTEIGFAGVIASPKDKRVDLRPCDPVEVPLASVIFIVPVEDGWGL